MVFSGLMNAYTALVAARLRESDRCPFAAPQPLRPARRANLGSRDGSSRSAVVSSPFSDASDSPCIGSAGTALCRVLPRPTAAPALADTLPPVLKCHPPAQAAGLHHGATSTVAVAWAKTLACARRGRERVSRKVIEVGPALPVRSRGSCAFCPGIPVHPSGRGDTALLTTARSSGVPRTTSTRSWDGENGHC